MSVDQKASVACNVVMPPSRFERLGNLPRDGQGFADRMAPRAMRCDTSSPSTSSITRALTPSPSSSPWIAMFGWFGVFCLPAAHPHRPRPA
jgi:hypothetical protein